MCGIHGNTKGYQLGKDVLTHRGPDHYGVFRDENVMLEHWRLSIIDLSPKGNQPMSLNGDNSPVIAYNGEVYNFLELKEKIKNVTYKSSTDTEVILHLYNQHGLNFLEYLNGMFALAIYDRKSKYLIIARDRFGIKPLYYAMDDESNIYFASELKAFIYNLNIELSIDHNAIQSMFHLLYIQGDRTPFNEIKKLPPGSYLIYNIETRQMEIKKYHSFKFGLNPMSMARYVDSIADLLSNSVKIHMISDVPVGALLSGGVDSSLMVALMSNYSKNILTYSVGYGGNHLFDESKYFNLVAEKYNTKHHHTLLLENQIGTLAKDVCSTLDEPIGDTSVLLNYYIFGFVAKSVKVCLSGLGGDELFGGYNRYLASKFVPIYLEVPRVFREVIRALVAFLPASRYSLMANKIRLIKAFLLNVDSNLGETYCNFIDYLTSQKESPIVNCDRFTNTIFRSYWEDELVEEINRIYRYDIENYMVNDLLLLTDKMSMVHSLEARVPFLENTLVDLALSIPQDKKINGMTLKYLLKEVAKRYLPKEIVFRRKQGFSSPISMLLSSEKLKRISLELIENDKEYVGILNKDLFINIIRKHLCGKEDYSLQIFNLIVYLDWMKTVYEKRSIARFSV